MKLKKISVLLLLCTLFFTFSEKKLAAEETLFKERMVYFDRGLDDDDNFNLLKKVIVDAKKLGFNTLVLNQEYIYARLSHKNTIIENVKKRYSEIELLTHAQGMRLVVMHFNADVPTFVVQDADASNPFYKEGKFDFSESNRATTKYIVKKDIAVVDAKEQVVNSASLIDGLYHFKEIKVNTEYKLTINATTKNYKSGILKVSVLDEDRKDENGKVLFGVQKYFRGIVENSKDRNYTIYFNSLNHKNLNGAIKIYLANQDGITINSLGLKEVGYKKNIHIKRADNRPIIRSSDGSRTYQLNVDYIIEDEKLLLLTSTIKKENSLLLSWYPRIDVSRFEGHGTTADICADEELYHTIMIDQYKRIKSTFNGKVDGIAFNIDEWREAGWNDKCSKLYASDFNATSAGHNFRGGDYIGISTKRMIENILKDENGTVTNYVMSDMFDPNFNGKDPYMGVKDGAVGAIEYLPKDTIVFNWFPNPYEPGLEDKRQKDFLMSAKHFSDHGISQIIAGYHDDLKNLDANIDIYKESDEKTKESIVGFMFLIWFQDEKNATYNDMGSVVKRICTELPGKWPEEACK